MKAGVVGLGLIGGSLAKALKLKTHHTVYAFDTDEPTMRYAVLTGAADGELTDENISECDYIFIAVYPAATVAYLKEKAPFISKSAVVIDCGGVKRFICEACMPLAKEYGFTFIGGHPMAGFHRSGFKYSDADLFNGASMILTPDNTRDILRFERVTEFIKSLGFGSVTVTTPEQHDKIIAFTSQLAHIVSNAYVKSPCAQVHRGFSAGSYKDLTRVAALNENMWTELFLENRDNLLSELDCIIASLEEYRDALERNDGGRLRELLKEGSDRKERIDFK